MLRNNWRGTIETSPSKWRKARSLERQVSLEEVLIKVKHSILVGSREVPRGTATGWLPTSLSLSLCYYTMCCFVMLLHLFWFGFYVLFSWISRLCRQNCLDRSSFSPLSLSICFSYALIFYFEIWNINIKRYIWKFNSCSKICWLILKN